MTVAVAFTVTDQLLLADPVINPPPSQVSIFTTQTPTSLGLTDGVAYEMGTLFQSTQAGQITGIRFWKDAKEAAGHVGNIWSASGTKLATVTFAGETASGWQEQNLTTPLTVTANTTYVVSVGTTTGNYYVATPNGLASPVTNVPLSTVVGSNGVYISPPGTFPTTTYQASNYFRDVVFLPSGGTPLALSTAVSPTSGVSGTTFTVTLTASGGTAPYTYSTPTATGVTFTPVSGKSNQWTFTPTATVTVTGSVTDAVGSKATSSTTATVTATSAVPSRANTGYQNAPDYPGSLTAWTGGNYLLTSNQTYSFIDFSTVGWVYVGNGSTPVSGVKFHGCRFQQAGGYLTMLFGDNITFEYCSFEPATTWPSPDPDLSWQPTNAQGYQTAITGNGQGGSHIAQLTVTNCDFWGWANAIDVNGSTQAKPQVYRNNYFHNSRNDGGIDHTDGPWCADSWNGSYVTFDNNNVQAMGNTRGLSVQGTAIDHCTITNNWFGGFNGTIGVGGQGTATNCTFTGNTFSTYLSASDNSGLTNGGPSYSTFGTGLYWRNNKWHVPAGAAWGNPAHDGWYWMPVGDAGQTDDTVYVSQTDYTG